MVQQVMLCGSLPSLLPHTTEPEFQFTKKGLNKQIDLSILSAQFLRTFDIDNNPSSNSERLTEALIFFVKPIYENV
jgi:hypothetical protein